jgi:hypothetical protein
MFGEPFRLLISKADILDSIVGKIDTNLQIVIMPFFLVNVYGMGVSLNVLVNVL